MKKILPARLDGDRKISELTVSELEQLIRDTVQEAVAEVIIEFSLAAEMEAELQREAELADYLRTTLQNNALPIAFGAPHLDD